jgi:SsrA-binding protein
MARPGRFLQHRLSASDRLHVFGTAMSKKKSPAGAKSQTKSAEPAEQTISENRKARHRYEVLEKLECGIVLRGSEVKSLREHKVSIDEAYARVRDGELWLVGADIAEYKQATLWNHEPKRVRKLLVQKKQLDKLSGRTVEKGLTLVPLRIYFSPRGLVKVQIGVCRGKKLHDKRETLKANEARRSIDREMKKRKR